MKDGLFFFFSSRRRHTRFDCDWSSDVCSSDLRGRPRGDGQLAVLAAPRLALDQVERAGRRRERLDPLAQPDRKSVVEGKSVDLGGRRIIKKKKRLVLIDWVWS